MTPKRYLAFGALTVAIQTGVIASQPSISLPKNLNEFAQMHAFNEVNKAVTLSFAAHHSVEKSAVISELKSTPANADPVDTISQNVPNASSSNAKVANASKRQTAPKRTDTATTEMARQAHEPTTAKPQTVKSAEQNKPTPNTSSKADATTAMKLMAANTLHQQETEEIAKSSEREISQMAEIKTQDNAAINNSDVTPTSASKNTKATPEVIELATPTFASQPPQPTYPRMARKKGLEGTATIEVMFNEFGQQLALTLVKSSGVSLLDQAALEAVETWQFEAPSPKLASHYKVRVPIRFALN
ncbi:energy transducer TonB [Shewanella sp. LC6]|uniref:energy transducer TonB n=1 Tax=unclassified Shewanella TaxID=196818 RepID=UPI000B518D1C|nr:MULTISPECIES: energy transducer TonB [unclassified Shewanella]ASF17632.1 energy transducer TonB [Shewanella sp. FDAARGOS_354]QQK61227.1 energy transducer TonB [Shewanella sp. LC6]TPE50092.1 energy transducer TonB [Shewanella sp. LC2]